MEITNELLTQFFDVLLPHLNKVQRRVAVGAVSVMLVPGNKTRTATAAHMRVVTQLSKLREKL